MLTFKRAEEHAFILLQGFPHTLKYYFTRIHILLARIAVISEEALQTNRSFVDKFNCSWSTTYAMDHILAGVRKFINDSSFEDQLLERFKSHIDDEELRMRKRLRSVRYHIDAANTLSLVTGSGRIEKASVRSVLLLFILIPINSVCCSSCIFSCIEPGMFYRKHARPRCIPGSWET